jgi:hypothetical protein
MLPLSQEILIQAINYPDFLREASLYSILLRLEKLKNRTYSKFPIRIRYTPPPVILIVRLLFRLVRFN